MNVRSILILVSACGLGMMTPAGSAFGQTDAGFSWVHPQPLGDLLLDVVWTGSGSWTAVSANGFIYRTVDRGVHWNPAFWVENRELSGIASNDRISVAVGNRGTLLFSRDDGVSWTLDSIPGFQGDLNDVSVVDSVIVAVGVLASGEAGVIRSHDLGRKWVVSGIGVSLELSGIDMIDDTFGWAVGASGYLVQTTDGGVTWTHRQLTVPGSAAHSFPRFRSRDTGLIAGNYGNIFVTHDGGKTWSPSQPTTASTFRDAVWVDDTTVVVVGDNRQARSFDAGRTWEQIEIGSRLYGVSFSPAGNEGMTVGRESEIFYSDDWGTTWSERRKSARRIRIYDLSVGRDGNIAASGDIGRLLISEDKGETWTATSVDPGVITDQLLGVRWISSNNLVTYSSGGQVFHSSDRGSSWTERHERRGWAGKDVSFPDSLFGWIVGGTGVLKTTDGGISWRYDTVVSGRFVTCVHAVDRSLVYVAGTLGLLLRSTDGGDTWETIETGVTVPFSMVRGDSSGQITLGGLYSFANSTDGGETWVEHLIPDTLHPEKFSFLTPLVGWAGQYLGPLLSTSDGGATWKAHEHGLRKSPAGNSDLAVVELVSPGYGFIAGAYGNILRFQDPEVSSVKLERLIRQNLDLSTNATTIPKEYYQVSRLPLESMSWNFLYPR